MQSVETISSSPLLVDNVNELSTSPMLDILHRHSINSLLDHQHDILSASPSETMSINDLLGLNSPRGGLMNFTNSTSSSSSQATAAVLSSSSSSSNGLCTPPASNGTNFQMRYDDSIKYNGGSLNYASVASRKMPRNLTLGGINNNNNNIMPSSSTSAQNFYTSRAIRSTSLSDSSSNNSSAATDHHSSIINGNNSRVNSPNSDSSAASLTSPEGSLVDVLNLLTLNSDSLIARTLFGNNNDLDLAHSENIQALQALKYLQLQQQQQQKQQQQRQLEQQQQQLEQHQQQQQQSLFGSFSPSHSINNNSSQQLFDQWNGGGATAAPGAPSLLNTFPNNIQLEKAARFHRTAASVHEATCTWSGILPVRTTKPSGLSSKVFLGGVPWDITEAMLVVTFKPFGPIRVEWPGKDKQASQPKGYVYIIFENEKNVKALLQACTADYANFYFKISSKRMKAKEVQVIPWIINDSNCTKSTTQKLDPSKTVFVGALHGMLTAEGLAKIMNDLFGGVVYTGLDTDKHKYPIGSGRVTFDNRTSYAKAINAAFIEIKTSKFTKKVQVDPYIEDSICTKCLVQQGPYFCRDMACFRYFCRSCWQERHNNEFYYHHKPMMRNSKTSQVLGFPNNNNTYTNNSSSSSSILNNINHLNNNNSNNNNTSNILMNFDF